MTAIPGIRHVLRVYLASDKTGHLFVFSLESPVPFPPVENPDPSALVAELGGGAIGALAEADDWRLMTDDEIRAYKENEYA